MAKIKLTKTELKTQRDALKQYERFLPTLQLKKQQLQLEMRSCLERIAENEVREKALQDSLSVWTYLFGDESLVEKILSLLTISNVRKGTQNIAGVNVPVYECVDFDVAPYDFFTEAPFVDDSLDAVREIVSVRIEREIIREQYRLIGQELRVTTQRVNLFEKVKIPEAKENIRVIGIAIGDGQTAAVARSKIAKKKLQEAVA